ncbi:hypothetical protein [Thalassotalea marina]|uniref:CBM11 domain-containing protein n=1 Tax=Thalassotalea marina TaxID=1673741 RepID=A0A919BBH6_9GAMM|nr:hypothetical protein [Thalassotalea marina]GHF77906.1 hypothetical protein GCM10017161_01150 [Thalassotalea marina]
MTVKSVLFAVICASFTSTASADLNPKNWRYATDPHGSKAIYDKPLVNDEFVAISFVRVPRVDKENNSWVELIYDLPNQSLKDAMQIELTYQSDKPLVIKLSQKQYGGEGDGSYAHYQTILPKADNWRTQTVSLESFSRPDWTPAWSKDKGIIKDSVSALYFVPDLKDEQGGDALIKIKHLSLMN